MDGNRCGRSLWSPDGSERLLVLLAVRARPLDEEQLVLGGGLVLLVHALTPVAVHVAVVHLHRRLGVQTGTGRFCRVRKQNPATDYSSSNGQTRRQPASL